MDDWICDNVEKTCHSLQKNFGISLRTIKYLTITIYVFLDAAIIVNRILKSENIFNSISTMLVFLVLPYMMITWSNREDEHHVGPELVRKQGRINPIYRIVRYVLYGITILTITIAISEYYWGPVMFTNQITAVKEIFYCLFFVLLACTPLPPCESKLRQKINNIKASFAKPEPIHQGSH